MPISERLTRPLLADNPVTVQVLGLCSALAVSSSLRPAAIMAISVIAVMIFSSVTISLLRQVMPRNIRLILEVTVIASAVIVVDEVLMVVAPDVSFVLSVFIGLIITNCIVLGRVEAFALHNPVGPSFLDALGNGAGYAVVLLLIAATRELFGAGSLYGLDFLPDAYPRNEMMLYAPSAFFLLGLIVWGGHAIQRRTASRRSAGAQPAAKVSR
ncbi:MAG: NADH:ubiquinone reductase (Na(+)-transporting) subunit D [Woeseia sp.]|nr:NADH:ubiquinone reductase (Na(+)-transporting) subunit D [Woeseia sp.]NNL53638.1 NADH:ubiquinone reductase (Na(+)-transporting) subunit D [Woeseia sp.]